MSQATRTTTISTSDSGTTGGRRKPIAYALACVVLALLLAWRYAEPMPRVWATSEVPIAFWAWRAAAPTADEIDKARTATNARTLFLRAGQLDIAHDRLTRIRTIEGEMPAGVELHFVYNATEALLDRFARIDAEEFASVVSAAFAADVERARGDSAHVTGIQLDLDAPTNSLARYAELVASLRRRLPGAARISITGLPTWMDSPGLPPLLAQTDFWIPQFYGDQVPRTLDERSGIADFARLRGDIVRTRNLKHPFYAGLPAYGYALLFTEGGKLISLHGDFDLTRAANDPRLKLVERRATGVDNNANDDDGSGEPLPAAWQYIFQASDDTAVGGARTNNINLRRGEHLLIEMPTGAGLASMAGVVRRDGGAGLLGICIFRLPANADNTLDITTIAAALADRSTSPAAAIELRRSARTLVVRARNTGAATLAGEDAFAFTLEIPPGSLREVGSLRGFTSYDTLCRDRQHEFAATPRRLGKASDPTSDARPCGPRRADTVRLRARSWAIGARARAALVFAADPPVHFTTESTLAAETGRPASERRDLTPTSAAEQHAPQNAHDP